MNDYLMLLYLKYTVCPIEEHLFERRRDMIAQKLAEHWSVLISRVLLVPYLIECTAWTVLLRAPRLLHDDIVHSHCSQDGVDFRGWLPAEYCVHILGTIPGRGGWMQVLYCLSSQRSPHSQTDAGDESGNEDLSSSRALPSCSRYLQVVVKT